MKNNKYLRRDRVEKALDLIYEYPLTILSATMGYGKTTAVRNYFNNQDTRTIWVSLLGSDGDEYIFWKKLTTSIERIFPGIGTQLQAIGFPIDARMVYEVMDLIWKVNDGAPTVIVIDDFHLINQSRQLGKLIEIFSEEAIPNLHIVLVSRTRPMFNHTNLFAKGLCYYLDTELLAFNQQEIKEYLDLMGYRASKKEIGTISNYTNGWISAIYLLQIGLQQGVKLTEVSYITQLVDKNLFSSFPENIKDALLQLSVLDSFTLQQAEQILENPKISSVLDQLMQQNAFIEYDRLTGLYKLHNVLLDFLREKYVEGPEKQQVYYRAGKWFLDQEDFVQAIEYYHRAEKIEELLEHLNWSKYMHSGFLGVRTIYQIFQEIPEEWYVKYPLPILHFALCFALSKNPVMVEGSSKIVRVLEDHFGNTGTEQNQFQNRVLGEIEIVKIFLVFNDAPKMVELSLKADKLLNGEVSCTVFRDDAFTFGVPHFLYSYYREAGRLEETVECLKAGFPPNVFDGSGMGCEYVAQAEYALETGRFNQVDMLVDKAVYKAQTANQVCMQICADFTRMRHYLVQGESVKAKELLKTSRKYLTDPKQIVSPQSLIIYNATLDMCEGYLYGCLNDVALIPEWLSTGEMPTKILMMKGLAFPCIVYGKAVMLEQNWPKLEILCEQFKEEYQIFHNQLGYIHNAIYEAVAKYHLYGRKEGVKTLIPALQDAGLDGIVLPFAEHSNYVLPILYEVRKSKEVDQKYLEELITLCERYQTNIKTVQELDPLTEREIQVVKLLSQGLTQREIASQLYFSVSTVKKHLESIYRKLNVNNKVSAVQKARENNLI